MKREWTIDEIKYLKEHIGVHKICTIAQKLGRSYTSVIVKMKRLGLSNTKLQTGFLTIGELAEVLKVERNTVKWWITKHGLPYKKRVTRKSRSFYFIDTFDFWEWAEKHKEKVQFSKMESLVLLPEPHWVNEERRMEKQIKKKKNYKYWTTKEDQRLLELRKKGLKYAEIGQKMNRSSLSVERRFKRLQ